MILLPPEIRFALRADAIIHRNAQRSGRAEPDLVPLLKLFNPAGPAVFIATEPDADGDTLFGVADMGFPCPESGHFSLSAIAAVRLPWGMRIERDLHFEGPYPLGVYAEAAHIAGHITEADDLLATVAPARDLGSPAQP